MIHYSLKKGKTKNMIWKVHENKTQGFPSKIDGMNKIVILLEV